MRSTAPVGSRGRRGIAPPASGDGAALKPGSIQVNECWLEPRAVNETRNWHVRMKDLFCLMIVVVVAGLALATVKIGAAAEPSSILLQLEQRLKPILADLKPTPTIEYPEYAPSLVVRYQPQKFLVHGRNPAGAWSTNVEEQIGPSFTGFVLKIHLQSLGEVNSAKTPQTIQEPYWRTFLEVTPLPGTTNQIYWAVSSAWGTDEGLLDRLKKALGSLAGKSQEQNGVKPSVGRGYQEIAAARPAPDLTRLAELSAPNIEGPAATESFYDILKLREAGRIEAVPVLEEILQANLASTRIHGFAAAQALFCIAPLEASNILSRPLLTEQYRAGLAFKYTAHWEMREPQRSRFIEQYLLQNVSSNLVLELTAQTATNLGRVDFVLTLLNSSGKPVHIPGRTVYLGECLFFRDTQGQFARSGETADYEPPMPRWVELGPGQTHQFQIRSSVRPAAQTREARHLISPQAAVVLSTEDYLFDIGKPGRFEVLAMFEEHGTGKDHWAGRVVSKPVRIIVPGPAEK